MQNKPTHETVLSVQGLGKVIRGRPIVQNLSFEVRAGEIFGFLGPNGAGKTTTIRMLVGLVRPGEGSIHIAGHDLKKSFTKAISHVGCIVENPELYPSLTGYENLEFFARMAGLTTSGDCPGVVKPAKVANSGRADQRARPCRYSRLAVFHPAACP